MTSTPLLHTTVQHPLDVAAQLNVFHSVRSVSKVSEDDLPKSIDRTQARANQRKSNNAKEE